MTYSGQVFGKLDDGELSHKIVDVSFFLLKKLKAFRMMTSCRLFAGRGARRAAARALQQG